MLKASKLSRKSHKSSKDSVMRKSHISRKTLRSKSPSRLSRSSRSTSMKHMSPGMKRGHPISKRKASQSPRLRSIASSPHRSLSHRSKAESPVSIDRVRSIKGLKYEKRKHLSISPVRHMGPSSSHRSALPLEVHNMPPYQPERYSAAVHSPEYSPSRKKTRRASERYYTSQSVSPPPRHIAAPLHPGSHISHRTGNISPVLHERHRISSNHGEKEKHMYDGRNKHPMHSSSSVMPRMHSKETSVKVPYPGESRSRYRSASPNERYPPGRQKSFAPTLHERFSSVIESSRSEPRVRYSKEDLEKITIDIKRNVREPSPTLRHIMNPSDVKLVRRANEGHRPIFDREEIKQAPRDLREDAYYERKASGGGYNSVHPIDLREVENYQITRHRFDTHHDLFSSSSGRTLNDRWQNPDSRKDAMSLDRDEREKGYNRVPVVRNYENVRSRSRSGDRDFRSERYIDAKAPHRSDYQNRPHIEAPQPRNSVPYSHKSAGPLDARHKLNVRKSDRESHSSSLRSETKSQSHSDRHYSGGMPQSRVERHEHRSPEPHKWGYKPQSVSREKLPEFSRRPEKYNFKSWIDKSDVSPKRSDYFEHGGHEGSGSYSTRGSSRPFRSSRGFRARGFRGPMRGGSSYYRGSFRGFHNSSSPRGRGVPRR